MEWQELWGIKSAGTRSKEMEEVVVGVIISGPTSIMKKAPKEESGTAEAADLFIAVSFARGRACSYQQSARCCLRTVSAVLCCAAGRS